MDETEWETAFGCAEAALQPEMRADEAMADASSLPEPTEELALSGICTRFATSTMSLAELLALKEALERLSRDNVALRRKLAIHETAQASTAEHLDAAYGRVHELSGELLAARRHADDAEREFAEFRAAYRPMLPGAHGDDPGLRRALDQAGHNAAQRHADEMAASFARFLTQARTQIDRLALSLQGSGTGKLPASEVAPDKRQAA
ncbi:MAG TPA: hypothetical protein VM782_14395 [Stellaceae bacterium]|nr:hypothetical protein [Stellaceae bacterium]